MKNLQFPVMPGEFLEFDFNGKKVRGEVRFVIFQNTSNGIEGYTTIYEDDIFMKKCKTCTDENCSKKKCEYAEDGGSCSFHDTIPVDEFDEIYAKDIGYGKKYKVKSKGWSWEEQYE